MKKRILSLLLAILMVITVVPTISLADSNIVEYAVTGGNLYFDKSTGTITDCDTSVTEAIIPETIDGVKVTKIQGYINENIAKNPAFQLCKQLKKIVLPDTVTDIGTNAFNGLSSLTSIVLSNSLKILGEYTFHGCTSLKTVVIPDGVTTIGHDAFDDCTSLTNIEIPVSVESIGYGAFRGCTNLKNVKISGPVTVIEQRTFSDCENLNVLYFPKTLKEIKDWAFYRCSNITDIYFPGTEDEYNKINISISEAHLRRATIHCESHTHSYTSVVTAPTCTAKGYTTYTCSCGNSYKDNYTNALGHNYSNGKCTRCGVADPNYKAPTSVTFSDVAAKAYYANAVQWAVENRITNGTDATHFSPDQGCTRGQVVTFLWRAAGSPTVSGDAGFVDVKSSDYFYEAVKWAVANGITNGTDAKHFSPNDTCTRAQVVTFMYRAEGSPATSGSCAFVDVKSSDYYYNAVIWAVANEITNGTDATHFSPSATCTRAQVVTFLYRNAQK
jgi:hypothetical protein